MKNRGYDLRIHVGDEIKPKFEKSADETQMKMKLRWYQKLQKSADQNEIQIQMNIKTKSDW